VEAGCRAQLEEEEEEADDEMDPPGCLLSPQVELGVCGSRCRGGNGGGFGIGP